MWRIITTQQKEIQELKKAQKKTEKKVKAADQKIEATGAMVDKVGTLDGWWQNTSLGGYGELHYNGGKKDEVDFHRFVLFFGHDFTDDLHFFSELEIEHVITPGPGEVELEQAWIEADLFDDRQHVRAGLFLLPVGILNENHEPPTFFGVERNLVEKNIIPSTWWEPGFGFNGQIGAGFSYDAYIHSGLKVPTTGGSAYKIRSGRQKGGKARAEDGAGTLRVKWTGVPGVELSASGQYQRDITQGAQTLGLDGRARDQEIGATLVEVHADILRDGWGLRALYARWDLWGGEPEAIGRDVQMGWYVEPSYRFKIAGVPGKIGVFARYSEFDNEAGDNEKSSVFSQADIGFNYWPHPDVVVKFDFQFQWVPEGQTKDNRVNLGLGYQF